MPVPWLVVGKLVLNNLDSVMAVVKPAFTRRKAEAATSQTDLISQQITELQSAAAGNAEQIKALAEQLKQVVTALDDAAIKLAAEHARTRRLCLAALAVAGVALILAVVAIFGR